MKEEVSVIGRVCCDSNGKLNAQSVMLEGSQELSSGARVKLDLSEVRQFALFPGQVMYDKLALCAQSNKIGLSKASSSAFMWKSPNIN